MWAYTRTKNLDDYMIGGRGLNPLVAALSAAAMLWVKRFPVGNFGVFVLDGLLYTAVFAGVIVLLYRRSVEYEALKRRGLEILKRRAG